MIYEEAHNDFDAYQRVFAKEAAISAELMRTLLEKFESEKLCFALGYPSVKELYDITNELSYTADRTYKKEKGIDDRNVFLDSYFSKTDVLAEMRTLLREEIQNYFGERNEPDQ